MTDSGTFIITQTLTVADIFSANSYILFSTKYIKRLFAFFTIVAALGFVLRKSLGSPDDNLSEILALIAPLLIAVVLILLVFIFSIYVVKKWPQRVTNVVYRFTPWGIERRGQGFEFKRPWQKVKKIKETNRFFLLYISEFDAHIIPKRAFNTMGELVEFRQLLKRVATV